MTEEEMMNETEISSDDRLFAALAYVFAPIFPIIIMLMPDKKDRPFIRAHNAQALIAGVLLWVFIVVTFFCGSIVWLLFLYWGYVAYQGKTIKIPVITDFAKNQNWA